MAMKIWFQWWSWHDDSGLKMLNGYPHWESHWLASAQVCDRNDDHDGGTFIWVGAIYESDIPDAFEIYTDLEKFHKDVENLKENGIIR